VAQLILFLDRQYIRRPRHRNGKVFAGSWTGAATGDFGVLRAFSLGAGSGGGTCTGSAPPAVLAGTQTLQPGVDTNSSGSAEAFQVTGAGCGTVNALNLYVDASSTASTIVVGLYADNAGNPGALLTQASMSAPVRGGWICPGEDMPRSFLYSSRDSRQD
jgi:hypothetical protein